MEQGCRKTAAALFLILQHNPRKKVGLFKVKNNFFGMVRVPCTRTIRPV